MKKSFLFYCLLFLSQTLLAQGTWKVSGVVIGGDDNQPIIGANVQVKDGSQGTVTDFDGNFELNVPASSTISVSYLGYETYEQKLTTDNSFVRVVLKGDTYILDEFVAVGYGMMKKSDLTGAISSVKAEALQKTPSATMDQALQGRVAGVTVNANSGQPGATASIRIRGTGSALGDNEPIYVVDGVITTSIAFLSPSDIQTTEILKDASATAIYGSRGANGVVLITTKNGSSQSGKANISVDSYWGIQNRWRKLDLMQSKEMVETKLRINGMKDGASPIAYYQQNGFNAWMYVFNTGSSPFYPVIQSNNRPDGFDYSSVETDWQDEVFNRNAFMHNYNVSIDGGNDKGHYAFSASYYSQDGTIIGSNYERLTLRFNSDFQVRKWLKIGEHLSFMSSQGRNAMNNSSSPGASVISAALAMAPWDPTHYPEGSVNSKGEDLSGQIAASSNFVNVTNPFSMVEHSHPKNNRERWVGDVFLEINPLKGLVLRSSVSLDYSLVRDRLFKDAYKYSTYDVATNNYISSSMARSSTLMEETTLTYSKDIGRHSFSIMAGQTAEEINFYSLSGSGANIVNPTPINWYLKNSTEDKLRGDDVWRERRLSFLGRVHYSYANRYMATVNFRADGSSKFPENTWGYFPSAALAWRISEESFMKDIDNLDMLKLRLGWGQVGNDRVPNNSFTPEMGSSDNVFYGYPFGPNSGAVQELQTGAAMLNFPNRNGKWETHEQLNIGVDFGFWQGLLTGNVDFFRRDTKDALLYVPTAAHVGNQYDIIKNVGVIRNQGIEIALDHQNRIGKVGYSIGGNVSFIKNELIKLNGGAPIHGDKSIVDLGLPLYTFWGYKYEGVYGSDQEVAEHLYSNTGGVHAGDARFADISGPDGIPDGKIDDFDKTNIGNPFPWLTYGLNIGVDLYGFDVQIFFQGIYGNQVYNALRLRTEGEGDNCTLSPAMKDVWVGYTDDIRASMEKRGVNWMELENRDGTIPNPTGSGRNKETNSRFVEDGAYLRLKNMQIGYTIPKRITQKAHIDRCRFYVSANNLFTLTKYTGYDPEVGTAGVDYGNYPQSRTFTFGINLNF